MTNLYVQSTIIITTEKHYCSLLQKNNSRVKLRDYFFMDLFFYTHGYISLKNQQGF